ncbi:Concanavalin A-like lectin/glucanases superfamily [Pelomyxa schiedti]|nr:Concanavalin A-like lectin/glucanases superfamily [Pelomyxa schiedti]
MAADALLAPEGHYCVEFGNPISISPPFGKCSALTVEAWFKLRAGSTLSGGSGQHVVNCGGGWSTPGFSLFLYEGNMRIELQNTTKTIVDNGFGSRGVSSIMETWTHAAFTWDGNNVVSYLNGQRQSRSGTFRDPFIPTAQQLGIGTNVGIPGHDFKGLIRDVRIWTVARTSEQILASMQGIQLPIPEGVLFRYLWNDAETKTLVKPLFLRNWDGSAISTPQDLCGQCGDASDEFRLLVKAAKFSGTGFSVGRSPFTETRALTVETWFRMEDVGVFGNTFGMQLLHCGGISPSDGFSLGIFKESLRVNLSMAAMKHTLDIPHPFPLAEKWVHVAFTWSATDETVRFYVNGKCDIHQGKFFSPSLRTDSSMLIGKNSDNSNPFLGLIRDVRVWNVCRTAQEIKDSMLYVKSGAPIARYLYNSFEVPSIVIPFNMKEIVEPVPSFLASDIASLENDATTEDLSICVEGTTLRAHALILYARVPFLKKLISGSLGNCITLSVKETPLKCLLHYCYTDKLSTDQLSMQDLMDIITLARAYTVPGLVLLAERKLIAKLNVEVTKPEIEYDPGELSWFAGSNRLLQLHQALLLYHDIF